jgi:hypothetical protein
MPIYLCITPAGTVPDAVRPQIAKEITRTRGRTRYSCSARVAAVAGSILGGRVSKSVPMTLVRSSSL